MASDNKDDENSLLAGLNNEERDEFRDVMQFLINDESWQQLSNNNIVVSHHDVSFVEQHGNNEDGDDGMMIDDIVPAESAVITPVCAEWPVAAAASTSTSTISVHAPAVHDLGIIPSTASPRACMRTNALFFGWLGHPCTKLYHNIVEEISDTYDQRPRNLAALVVKGLEDKGIPRLMVCVDQNDKPHRKIMGKNGEFLGSWRDAKPNEISTKVIDCFKGIRRHGKRSTSSGADVGAALEVQQRQAPIMVQFVRQPWSPVTNTTVCFGSKYHSGTILLYEAVVLFANNTVDFPEWSDDILDLVKAQLPEKENTVFLTFVDSNGNPCHGIGDGLWVKCTELEVLQKTKEIFHSIRGPIQMM